MHDTEDAFIRRVSDELRAPVRVDPGFDARVMAAVRAEHAAERGSPTRLGWLVRPRTVRISPLAGLALAAALAGIAVLGTHVPWGTGDRPLAAPELAPPGNGRLVSDQAVRTVSFHLNAPGAASVSLIGEFNDWDPGATPLEQVGSGSWEARVPLRPGVYEYAFLVNGDSVIADPHRPQRGATDFGTPNSVITVGGDGR